MTETTGDLITAALVEEARRRILREGLTRIETCFTHLSEEEVWTRPNEHTVSVGNLVLHLCGNVRQQLVSGLGGAPDRRQRDLEFSERGPIPKDELLRRLREALDEVRQTLDRLDAESLLKVYRVQGFEESGVSLLVHVIEHFSYHVGQITWWVKSTKDLDVGYYAGLDLSKSNEP